MRLSLNQLAVLSTASGKDISKDPLHSISLIGNAIAFVSGGQVLFSPATSASLRQVPLSRPGAKPTSVALVTFASAHGLQDLAILAGDDQGCLHVISSGLQTVLSQRVWREPLVSIRPIAADQGSDPGGELSPQSECITLCFPSAVARVAAFEVQAALKTHKVTGKPQPHRLIVDLWDLSESLGTTRTDALCLGRPPATPLSILSGLPAPGAQPEFLVVAGEGQALVGLAGEHVAAQRDTLVSRASGAIRGALGALSGASAIGTGAASWLLGKVRGASASGTHSPAPAYDPSTPGPSAAIPAPTPLAGGAARLSSAGSDHSSGQASQVNPFQGPGQPEDELEAALKENPPKGSDTIFCLEDAPRSFRSLAVASGQWSRLCAAADNLGRILVLDLTTGIILHVLKGYRDAQVAWTGGFSSAEPLMLLILVAKTRVLEAWVHKGGGAMALGGTLLESHHLPLGSRYPSSDEVRLVSPVSPFGCFGPASARPQAPRHPPLLAYADGASVHLLHVSF